MIASLRGKLLLKGINRVILDVRGVGYSVAIPLSTLEALPQEGEVFLHIHTALRENALELYGFIDQDEKALFEMLLGVAGVGPRLALAILSGMSPDRFRQAVLTGNLHTLTAIPGLGKKSAERIVLELKEKIMKTGVRSISSAATSPVGTLQDDLISSLVNLGYKDSIARDVAREVLRGCPPEISLEEALKMSLGVLVK